ncbi:MULTISPECIES: c-type cytochrome [unclassified Polaribacter]|uniref:c-type cytochrome n=1 Tax=unclassified Polaribacter TaxID=196858 RepID=UPI0011BECEEF|nr:MULTISPECIES: cytochrome c [unclassified Polaribacter]TXD52087.1 cytochrome c [Polaribacter sp. IC063]TXD59809.1 cytochrome c [Polaribacter sp. IC066]
MKKILLTIFFGFIICSFTHKSENYNAIQQDSKLAESIKNGKEVYTDMCMSCHLPNGEGKPKIYPPLAKSDYLMEKREASIRAIKYGLSGKISVNGVVYKKRMARLGLEADEIADVMNYITNTWGNKNLNMITVEEVEAVSKN